MWIDMEEQRPKPRERVIILIPFGLRVEDDTWTGDRWMNTHDYVSHWQPIDAPGSYSEIMRRPMKGEPLPPPEKSEKSGSWWSAAVEEHFSVMSGITQTQFLLRFEEAVNAKKKKAVSE